MGFLDRFRKPSMDSDDYKIRIKAIAAIDDETELSRIVCDDYNTDVRLTALKKINNQSTLANLLIKFSKEQYWPNHNISSYLLNKVDDKQTLVAAAKNTNDKDIYFWRILI